jgi:hypothetical protein
MSLFSRTNRLQKAEKYVQPMTHRRDNVKRPEILSEVFSLVVSMALKNYSFKPLFLQSEHMNKPVITECHFFRK